MGFYGIVHSDGIIYLMRLQIEVLLDLLEIGNIDFMEHIGFDSNICVYFTIIIYIYICNIILDFIKFLLLFLSMYKVRI